MDRSTSIDIEDEREGLFPDDDSAADDEVEILDGVEFRQIAQANARHQVPPRHRKVDYVDAWGIKIKAGMNFELNEPSDDQEPQFRDFARVVYITKDRNSTDRDDLKAVTLHFLRLRPAKHCDLLKSRFELCLLVLAPTSDKRADFERGLETCSLDMIVPTPREITFTNKTRDDFRLNGAAIGQEHWEGGPMVCRWKRIHLYSGTAGRKDWRITEEAWLSLSEEEADDGHGVPNAKKILDFLVKRASRKKAFEQEDSSRQQHRSLRRSMASLSIEPLTRRKRSSSELEEVENGHPPQMPSTYRGFNLSDLGLRLFDRNRPFTFADYFCGIGGVSAAARAAKLDVAYGIDLAQWAAESYRQNFSEPQTKTLRMHCGDFLASGTCYRMRYAAIVHFSPPCQAFSPNHTRPGKNDEANRHASLSIDAGLSKSGARFATMEQTSGLKTHCKNDEERLIYYRKVKRQFTDEGYNFRLKIINLAEYGAPSERKRLIVMASCPGQTLPGFPPPTHGLQHGLRPYRTVRGALRNMPTNDPLHRPGEMAQLRQNKARAKWNEPLARIIDTGGPAFLHPDGYPFTIAQGLRLQRFPLRYKLAPGIPNGQAWTGIGNSVPRDFMVLVYQQYVAALEQSDDEIIAYLQAAQTPVVLDSDDDEDSAAHTPGSSGSGARKRPRTAEAETGAERKQPVVVDLTMD